jgi:hypothetical protein
MTKKKAAASEKKSVAKPKTNGTGLNEFKSWLDKKSKAKSKKTLPKIVKKK